MTAKRNIRERAERERRDAEFRQQLIDNLPFLARQIAFELQRQGIDLNDLAPSDPDPDTGGTP